MKKVTLDFDRTPGDLAKAIICGCRGAHNERNAGGSLATNCPDLDRITVFHLRDDGEYSVDREEHLAYRLSGLIDFVSNRHFNEFAELNNLYRIGAPQVV